MKINFLSSIILITIFTFANGVYSVSAQDAVEKNVGNKETYKKVLDILFFEELKNQNDTLASAVVRFLPSFLPESQITIIRKGSNSKIIYVKAENNIYSKINTITENENNFTPAEIASQIKTKKIIYDLNATKTDKLLTDFNDSLAKSIKQIDNERLLTAQTDSVETYLDGAYYQFWLDTNLNKSFLSVYDENIDKFQITGNLILAALSNKLRIEIEKGEFK